MTKSPYHVPNNWRDAYQELSKKAPIGTSLSGKLFLSATLPYSQAMHYCRMILENPEITEIFVSLHSWLDEFMARPGSDPMLAKEASDYPWQVFNDRMFFMGWYRLTFLPSLNTGLTLLDLGRVSVELRSIHAKTVPDAALHEALQAQDFIVSDNV